jgi:hypothetical protein
MKRYIVASFGFALVVILSASYPQLSDSGNVAGQRRGTRRTANSISTRKPAVDYSRFSHTTREHQASCKTCHKTPTANWKKVSQFPDVADFPDHDACVRCHRPQFFKNAQPVICSNCHQKTSPRDSARFEFRNPVRPRQFTIEFPHDRHQDVIARHQSPAYPVTQTVSLRFAHSRIRVEPSMQTNSLRYNNCEICHVPNAKPPVAPTVGWVDGFVPAADLFKAAPENHAACFSCHWKNQKPTKDSCEGCHKLAQSYLPAGVPERKSMKFTHAREQHVKECTACHINITKSASLKGLKPDVPITACSECHNKEGLRLDVGGELVALDKDRAFVCVYCHTSQIGRLNPPASHFLIAGRAAAKLR